jgi:ubiquitin carboxyl-terminal hydrolase 4/11/15
VQDQEYQLYAVSNHMGEIGGGHYTAHAVVQGPRLPPDRRRRWYGFNDSAVFRMADNVWRSVAAYVLFYERIEKTTQELEDEDDEEGE